MGVVIENRHGDVVVERWHVSVRHEHVEDICDMAGWFGLGSRRHYCDNAATCVLVIDGDGYPSCDVCRDEVLALGTPDGEDDWRCDCWACGFRARV